MSETLKNVAAFSGTACGTADPADKPASACGSACGAADPKALGRAVKKLFEYYPVMAPLTMFCILFSSVVSSIPSLFVQNVLSVIEKW